jgi:hypothetical protein
MSEEGAAMQGLTNERLEQIRQRLIDAGQTQREVFLRLAETEDRVAATFDRLAHDGPHGARRTAIARQARSEAARLRAYVSQAETSAGVGRSLR